MISDHLSPLDRAYLFDWLASVYLREADASAIALLRSAEGQALLSAVADVPGLAADAMALGAAVQDLYRQAGDDDAVALALAGRFGTLFLGGAGPDAAPPYASVYCDGRTHGAATDRAAAFLATHGLSVGATSVEPADHIGHMLAALAELSRREDAVSSDDIDVVQRAQHAYARSEILPWFPQFDARVQNCDPAGYYAAVVRLTGHALNTIYPAD